MDTPGMTKVMWGGSSGNNAANWRALGVQADAPVQFGYAVVAVSAGTALAEPVPDPPLPSGKTFGFASASTSEPAYCVLAQGDVNGNDTFSYVISHSFSNEIYIENEGE
jgi:hypothetical protein